MVMLTIKFAPEHELRGFVVMKDAALLTCLKGGRYLCGEKHLKALYEAQIPFEVVALEPEKAIFHLTKACEKLCIAFQVTDDSASHTLVFATQNGSAVITQPAPAEVVS